MKDADTRRVFWFPRDKSGGVVSTLISENGPDTVAMFRHKTGRVRLLLSVEADSVLTEHGDSAHNGVEFREQ